MDAQYLLRCSIFTNTLSTRLYPSENEVISKLTSEQLKLKEEETPDCFNSRVINALEGCNIKYQIRHNKLLTESSADEDDLFTVFKITSDREIKKIISLHCLLSLKYSENNRMPPTLLKSHWLDENIIDGAIVDSLPIARLSVSANEYEHTCMHVAMFQTALTSLSKPGQPRFLTTTCVHDCHAVIFWDQKTQTAMQRFYHDRSWHKCNHSNREIYCEVTLQSQALQQCVSFLGGTFFSFWHSEFRAKS